jgi:serine/threonine protein kinase
MPDGRVKLADMGIARLLSPEALTATLTLRGTPRYVSPEQARGDQVDSRADLYSLGCVLFEMLVGQPPFEGDLGALSYAHARCPAPRVRPHRPIGSARWTSSSPPRSRRISGRPPAERSRCADVS